MLHKYQDWDLKSRLLGFESWMKAKLHPLGNRQNTSIVHTLCCIKKNTGTQTLIKII